MTTLQSLRNVMLSRNCESGRSPKFRVSLVLVLAVFAFAIVLMGVRS